MPKINKSPEDIAIQNAVYVEQLKQGFVNDYAKVFDDIDGAIAETLGALKITTLSDLTKKELNSTLETLRTVQTELYFAKNDDLMKKLSTFSKFQVGKEALALDALKGPSLKVPKGAWKTVTETPVAATGALLDGFVKGVAAPALEKIEGAVRNGWAQGKTVSQVMRDIRGTKAANFKDGIIATSKKNAEAMVRTATQHVANVSRHALYQENDDLIKGYRWLSTLDGRTSSTCRSLDGKEFKFGEGPIPPAHVNCRSTILPELGDEWDFLDEGATRSSEFGYVDGNTTYYDWLQKQKPDFVDDVLGKAKGEIFRSGGLTPAQFDQYNMGRNFKPLTLEEMYVKNPEPFKKAGVTLKNEAELDIVAANVAKEAAEAAALAEAAAAKAAQEAAAAAAAAAKKAAEEAAAIAAAAAKKAADEAIKKAAEEAAKAVPVNMPLPLKWEMSGYTAIKKNGIITVAGGKLKKPVTLFTDDSLEDYFTNVAKGKAPPNPVGWDKAKISYSKDGKSINVTLGSNKKTFTTEADFQAYIDAGPPKTSANYYLVGQPNGPGHKLELNMGTGKYELTKDGKPVGQFNDGTEVQTYLKGLSGPPKVDPKVAAAKAKLNPSSMFQKDDTLKKWAAKDVSVLQANASTKFISQAEYNAVMAYKDAELKALGSPGLKLDELNWKVGTPVTSTVKPTVGAAPSGPLTLAQAEAKLSTSAPKYLATLEKKATSPYATLKSELNAGKISQQEYTYIALLKEESKKKIGLAPGLPADINYIKGAKATVAKSTSTYVPPPPPPPPVYAHKGTSYKSVDVSTFNSNGEPWPSHRAVGDASVTTYTGSSYSSINATMRGGKADTSTIAAIRKWFKTAPPVSDNLMTYRGIRVSEAEAAKLFKVGGIFQDKAFISTSGVQGSNFGGLQLRILVPKGSTGVAKVKHLSKYSSENEVLFNTGRFEVLEYDSATKRAVLLYLGPAT